MKKLFALVLAFCLILCMFAGCKQKNNNNNENGSGNGGNANDTPNYTVVTPIADGGSFDGGDYE